MKLNTNPLIYIIILTFFLLWGCGSDGDTPPTLPTQPDDGLRSEVFGARYIFTDSSSLQAQLRANRVIEKDEKKDEEDKKGERVIYLYDSVHIEFYGSRDKPESDVTSQNGVYWKAKKLAKLTGNVVLINKNGDKLESEELFWDEGKEQIYSRKFVRVQTPGKIVTSDSGIISNTTFTSYEFKGNVKAEYELNGEY